MRAVILAAGVARRLGAAAGGRPKSLLEFGGATLLERHLVLLASLGVAPVTVVTGSQADLVEAALAGRARTVHNPDYLSGSIVSLWTAREELTAGDEVLLMDADVLYHPDVLRRLVASRFRDCLLRDRGFEDGPEPVKLCTRHGTIVEFRKTVAPDIEYDAIGESVGFFRFSPESARELALLAQQYLDQGRRDEPYEEAVRDLILREPSRFGVEDVSGLPWIEIDFPEDVTRAREEVLPRIPALPLDGK
jgi:choline kinase